MKDLVELVQDDDRLKQERKRAKKNRDKYKGVSSADFSRSYSKTFLSTNYIEQYIVHDGYYHYITISKCCSLYC